MLKIVPAEDTPNELLAEVMASNNVGYVKAEYLYDQKQPALMNLGERG